MEWLIFVSFLIWICSTKRIARVHSYHSYYAYVSEVDEGFTIGLFHNGFIDGNNVEILDYYMNTKNINTVDSEIEAIAEEIFLDIVAKNAEEKIDLLYISDDNAMKYFVPKAYKDFPIVFSGVSQPLEEYEFLNDPEIRISGVLKLIPFIASIRLLNTVWNGKMGGKNFILIFDNSITGNALQKQFDKQMEQPSIKEELESHNITLVKHQISHFQEYMEIVNTFNKDPNVSGFYPIVFSLKDENNGVFLTSRDINAWTKDNAQKPCIPVVSSFCKDGYFGGYTISPHFQGYEVGRRAGLFFSGNNLNETLITGELTREICFNLDTAKKLNIEIEEIYLNYAKIYETTEPENFEWVLILFPLLGVASGSTVVIIVLVFVLIISVKRHINNVKWMKNITESISDMDLENRYVDDLLKNYKKNGKIGKSFRQIVLNLKEFKCYLPSSLFEKNDGNLTSSSFDSSSSFTEIKEKINGFTEIKSFRDNLSLSGDYRQITILLCSIPSLGNYLEVLNYIRIMAIMNKFIETISNIVEIHQGHINFSRGYSLVSSFNSTHKLSDHSAVGCSVALNIKEFYENDTELWDSKFLPASHVDLSIKLAVCSGNAICGNFGTNRIRLVNFLSNLDQEASTICKMNETHNSTILINEECKESVKYSHNFMMLDHFEQKVVSELISNRSTNGEDWWNKKKEDKLNCYDFFNKAFEEMEKKNYDKSKKLIEFFLNMKITKEERRKGKILLKKIRNLEKMEFQAK